MKYFKLLYLLLMLILLETMPVWAWTVTADFESGTLGTRAQGISGFDEAGSQTLYHQGMSASGSKSAMMSWPSGSTGWDIAHGYFDYPNAGHGAEIWLRAYFYFASPWSWISKPAIKIMRLHVSNSAGSNIGYHSVYANSAGNIELSNEVDDYQPDTRVKLDVARWQCVEMYIKFSSSEPIFRIWKDGALVYEDRTRKTMASVNDVTDFSYFMAYWNGGVPQSQIQYVDEIVITNERPAQRDANGNPMIGPITGQGVSPVVSPSPTAPVAPSGLIIIGK